MITQINFSMTVNVDLDHEGDKEDVKAITLYIKELTRDRLIGAWNYAAKITSVTIKETK